jgi:hypothetical protein
VLVQSQVEGTGPSAERASMATATNSRRPTLRSDDGDNEWPDERGANSRRKKSKQRAEDQAPLRPAIDYEEDEVDIVEMMYICCANLSTIRDFLLACKENLQRRHTCLSICETMHQIMQKVQVHVAANTVTPTLAEQIRYIVNDALASNAPAASTTTAAPVQTNIPTYSSIVKNAANHQAPTETPPPKYKVIVKSAQNCKGVQTSADTKKILMSKTPQELGIQAERVTMLRDNSVRIESRCPSVLKLGESETLKSLKLTAQPVTKSWPKIQIFDIQEDMTQEQLVELLSDQKLPDSVPETFVRKCFKHGAKLEQGQTTWIVEIHPAARQYLVNTGRIFSNWRAHKVRDFVVVTRCYHCQGFGHIAKHCMSPKVCGYCSSTDHESKDCRHKGDAGKHRCINCLRFQVKDHSHHAASNECPIYKNRLQNIISETQYDINSP